MSKENLVQAREKKRIILDKISKIDDKTFTKNKVRVNMSVDGTPYTFTLERAKTRDEIEAEEKKKLEEQQKAANNGGGSGNPGGKPPGS